MNDNKTILIFVLCIPVFMLVTSFDLSIQSDKIKGVIFLGYSYPLILLMYYFVRVKIVKPLLILSLGLITWTTFSSFLFNDLFITIGLFIISTLTILITIFYNLRTTD